MIQECTSSQSDGPYVVRSFAAIDGSEVERLLREGLLPGDIEYNRQPDRAAPASFWVVETDGQIVGTVAIAHNGRETASMLQLRVAREFQGDDRIARLLIRAAMECARERGVQKVIIESPGLEPTAHNPMGEESIVTYLRALGFEYSRIHESQGKTMLEFYRNLYDVPG